MRVRGIPLGNYETAAVITGAAGGMGRIYAEILAEHGYSLVLIDISAERLEQTAVEVRKVVDESGVAGKEKFRLLSVAQDLSVMEAAGKIAEAASGMTVDILINNAGLFFVKETANADRRLLSSIMMVHNYTPLMLCREFVPEMKKRGHGYVLNISSLAAWLPWPALGMYSNTKRFIKGFSRSLRIECRGTGVSVTAAYFGAVDTPLYPLKPSLRRLAVRIYVMIPPRKAAEKALRAMFRRRKGLMPGLLNHIFRPIAAVMPDWIVGPVYGLIRKHVRNL